MAGPTLLIGPAAAAYARALDRPPVAAPDERSPMPSFGAMLEQTMSDAIAAGHRGEAAATEASAGKASLQDVVEAVNAAELTLQTVVAVRDRMIAAYQEILRMPI